MNDGICNVLVGFQQNIPECSLLLFYHKMIVDDDRGAVFLPLDETQGSTQDVGNILINLQKMKMTVTSAAERLCIYADIIEEAKILSALQCTRN